MRTTAASREELLSTPRHCESAHQLLYAYMITYGGNRLNSSALGFVRYYFLRVYQLAWNAVFDHFARDLRGQAALRSDSIMI